MGKEHGGKSKPNKAYVHWETQNTPLHQSQGHLQGIGKVFLGLEEEWVSMYQFISLYLLYGKGESVASFPLHHNPLQLDLCYPKHISGGIHDKFCHIDHSIKIKSTSLP